MKRMTMQERADEVSWLLAGGVSAALIVEALGVRANALEIGFRRFGRSDLAVVFSGESEREKLRRQGLAA
jgi:hypothetical protein